MMGTFVQHKKEQRTSCLFTSDVSCASGFPIYESSYIECFRN